MPPLDEIRELTDGSHELFAQLLQNYLLNTDLLVAQLPAATVHQDAATARAAAHDIKSMSAMFGAMELSDLARDLEQMCMGQDLSGMADLTPRIQTEFERISVAITYLIDTPNI